MGPRIKQNKGQALTELAIFGSILIFCVAMLIQYGLGANYQQGVQMEAFRKAQKIAFHKSGPGSSTSLVLIKDKAIPDPRDQFGFAERSPVVGNASVVWDTNLSGQYVTSFAKTPDAKDLPAMYFEVDRVGRTTEINKVHKFTGMVEDAIIEKDTIENVATADVPPDVGEDKVFGFYTARFDKAPCPDSIVVVFEDPKHNNPDNPEKKEYYEVKVNKDDIKVMQMEGGFGGNIEVETGIPDDAKLLMHPYFRYNGLKRSITNADVDGDGKLEYIIAANKDKELLYIDYHGPTKRSTNTVEGAIQIDTAYAQVEAGDKETVWNAAEGKLDTGADLSPGQRQGLIQDTDKTIQHTASKLVKEENNGVITSHTELKATQKIIHKVRLNEGQVLEIPVEFSVNETDLYNWNK